MQVLRWLWARPGRELVATAILALVVLVVGSGWTPIMGRDEARFAQAAREMLDRGELVVPTFGGDNRYDKPILIYWCTMASYALLGVNEQAARLPSNLAGTLVVLLLAWSARRRWGAGAGALAGLLLLATPLFHVQARACTADLVMLLPTLAAALALEELWVGSGDWRHALVLWLGVAVAVLAKGPVGPAVLLATVVGVWVLERPWPRWQLSLIVLILAIGWWRAGPIVLLVAAFWAGLEMARSNQGRQRLRRLRWWWGVPLLLLMVVPWAVAAWLATDGEFFRVAVGRHVVARSLTPLESHGGFPGFYLLTGVVVAMPWLALLVPALEARGGVAAGDGRTRFHLAWLLAPLLMLELLATKLSHYWMPSYPAGVLLVVGWLMTGGEADRRARAAARALSGVGLAGLAAVPMVLVLVFDLDRLVVAAAVVAAPLLAALPVVVGRRAPRLGHAVAAGAAVLLFMVLLLGLFAPRLGGFLLGPRGASRALELRRHGDTLVIHKARDDELFFYLPVAAVASRTRADLVARLTTGGRFLAIVRSRDLQRLREDYPQVEAVEVGQVDGVDLAKGRWERIVLVQPPDP